jgi:hypothetical protein
MRVFADFRNLPRDLSARLAPWTRGPFVAAACP